MRNRLKRYLTVFAIFALLGACDKNFGEFNVDPTTTAKVDLSSLFSSSQVKFASYDPETLTNFCHAFMQYGWSDFWYGTTYELNDGLSNRAWNNHYANVLKDLEYVIPQLEKDPALSNTYAAARIWRVFVYQKLTDMYGDIPYFEAGKALIDGTFAPAYDTQQSIYADFVKELRAARDGLSTSAATVKGDQFYGGDASKWKKLANSLLLRIGMRMIKVDPAQASSLVKEAVSGGVMSSNDDMPILKYDNLTNDGFNFNIGDQHFTLRNTLVDHMNSSGDPRLFIYGAVYTKQKDASAAVAYPTGTTTAMIADSLAKYDWDLNTPDTYSNSAPENINRTRVRYDIYHEVNLPYIHFFYAHVEFLLAEAVLRGYISGDANDYYTKGVTAHMESFSKIKERVPACPVPSSSDISTYLANNPITKIGTSVENQIEQINTEYWVAGYIFEADEVWANWRRTGYPKLIPTPAGHFSIAGGNPSTGVIPRKLPYPNSEFSTNSANLAKALSVYGGVNDFTTNPRVWWDK